MITVIALIMIPFVIGYFVFTDLEKQLAEFDKRVKKLEEEKFDDSNKIF